MVHLVGRQEMTVRWFNMEISSGMIVNQMNCCNCNGDNNSTIEYNYTIIIIILILPAIITAIIISITATKKQMDEILSSKENMRIKIFHLRTVTVIIYKHSH